MLHDLFSPGIRIFWFLLILGSLGYAFLVYRANTGTFSFLMWIGISFMFGICFYLAGQNRWSRLPVQVKSLLGILLALGILVLVLCQTMILSRFFDKGEPALDYCIVLGAQMRAHGPSVVYRHRLDAAAAYLLENEDTICIVTGGKGTNEVISEGEGGKAYLMGLGIPENRILAETGSVDTVENIENAEKMIREHLAVKKTEKDNLRIGIITNNFHVFRGVRIAEHVFSSQLDPVEVTGIAAYTEPLYLPNNMLRETFGILRDMLAGMIL